MTSFPQPKNPLHGISLKTIMTNLVDEYGREGLAEIFDFNCFASNPTMNSSLNFLRKHDRARKKIEQFYLEKLTEEL